MICSRRPFQIGSRRKAMQLTNRARKFLTCMNSQTSLGSLRKLSTSISARITIEFKGTGDGSRGKRKWMTNDDVLFAG